MLTASEFFLVKMQVSMVSAIPLPNSNTTLPHLLSHWRDRFSANPTVIPVPPNAPPEVPRIMLSSSDKRYRLNIAASRVDLFEVRQARDEILDIEGFFSWCATFLADFKDTFQVKVGRIMCVITLAVEAEEPGKLLASHFCRDEWMGDDGPFNRPEDFELHAHKTFVMGGSFNVNSWVRCKTGQMLYGASGTPDNVILIEQDFNTLHEELESSDYSNGQIENFLRQAPAELSTVLNRYFPEREQ